MGIRSTRLCPPREWVVQQQSLEVQSGKRCNSNVENIVVLGWDFKSPLSLWSAPVPCPAIASHERLPIMALLQRTRTSLPHRS